MFWVNWIIILSFWFFGAQDLLAQGFPESLIVLGRLTGLIAAYFILVQFFLVGRNPFLEGYFGLDTLTRIHHTFGKVGILFLLTHPILLVGGYSLVARREPLVQFIRFLESGEYVFFAYVAALLFVVVAGLSVYIVRSKIKYETWYIVHLLVYLAIFLSFPHQLVNGGTLLLHRTFYIYWIALYSLVFISHLLFRIIRPVWLFQKHRFIVSRIVRETPSVVSVYITGKKMNTFSIKPGQFMRVRFLLKSFWFEAHPFSLSQPHDSNELRISVRELGDFTERVKDIPSGTPVFIEGPYGVFTNRKETSSKVLLLAGGIGITPLRTLAEEMGALGKDVLLLYGSRTRKEVVFKEELDVLSEKYQIRVIHVLSQGQGSLDERGYIDEEKVKRLVPDLTEREIYLCGPVQMVNTISAFLLKNGVKQENIYFERFSLHA